MRRGWLGLAGLLLLLGLPLVVASEIHSPAEVPWETAFLDGIPADRAEGLVVQFEDERDVWASRGYAIYRSRDGGPFVRQYTLRPRLGEALAGYSRSLRRRFGYQELIELLPLGGDKLVVFGGGDVYRVDLGTGSQERVHSLRYFGRGKGRGVMAHGLTLDPEGNVFYGEYPTHLEPGDSVRLWRGSDQARRWEIAFEFPPGAVRHIHNVQWDPYAGTIWMGTGDRDESSKIGYSRDRGATFSWIGAGSQLWRVCSLLFFPNDVVWATDADLQEPRIGRWNRSSQSVDVMMQWPPAPTFYSQALNERMGLIGLAEYDASVWSLDAEGRTKRLVGWTIPPRNEASPHPGVRLPRTPPRKPFSHEVLHINPLRTVEEEATIWRIRVAEALWR